MATAKRIFFYCEKQGAPDRAAYQHPIIVIAEGLRELGIPYHSDKDYWKLAPDAAEYLFRYDPSVTADDCDVVVVNSTWMHYTRSLPEGLFHAGRRYVTIYIDDDDGLYTHSATPAFRQFDVILRTHYNHKHSYPKNVLPWQFGFSGRMATALGGYTPYDKRPGGVLSNFRMSHSVRGSVKKEFLPRFEQIMPVDVRTDGALETSASALDRMLWEQTGRRHYPSYFARLKESKASFAFGGYFSSPFPRPVSSPVLRKLNGLIARLGLKTSVVDQFDSWRFWESLVAGCVTFHVDLDRYGAVLPVMPENWKHYVGIDLDDIEGSLAVIKENMHRFTDISKSGREWAMENYSPVAVAKRFIEIASRDNVRGS